MLRKGVSVMAEGVGNIGKQLLHRQKHASAALRDPAKHAHAVPARPFMPLLPSRSTHSITTTPHHTPPHVPARSLHAPASSIHILQPTPRGGLSAFGHTLTKAKQRPPEEWHRAFNEGSLLAQRMSAANAEPQRLVEQFAPGKALMPEVVATYRDKLHQFEETLSKTKKAYGLSEELDVLDLADAHVRVAALVPDSKSTTIGPFLYASGVGFANVLKPFVEEKALGKLFSTVAHFVSDVSLSPAEIGKRRGEFLADLVTLAGSGKGVKGILAIVKRFATAAIKGQKISREEMQPLINEFMNFDAKMHKTDMPHSAAFDAIEFIFTTFNKSYAEKFYGQVEKLRGKSQEELCTGIVEATFMRDIIQPLFSESPQERLFADMAAKKLLQDPEVTHGAKKIIARVYEGIGIDVTNLLVAKGATAGIEVEYKETPKP